VSLFTCYFDESGAPEDSAFVVVSGYLSSVLEWEQFNRRWRDVLAKYDVPFFHLKDFAHSRGAFADWKGNEAKRKRFSRELTNQIRRYARHGFTAIVDVRDWRRANQKYLLDAPEIDGGLACYPLCGKLCVELVKRWCEGRKVPFNEVTFVFHNGAKDKGKLTRRLEIDYGVTPIFDPPSPGTPPAPGVQAADFSASETGKHAPEIALGDFGGSREPRRSFVRLVMGVPTRTVFFNYSRIEQLVSAVLPPRSPSLTKPS